jgi:hypothetical protein
MVNSSELVAGRRRLGPFLRRVPLTSGLTVVVLSSGIVLATPAQAQSDQAQPAAPAAQAAPAPAPPRQDPPLPQTPPASDPQAATAGTPATVIDEQQIESLLGKRIESSSGDDMGRIVDVLADRTGQPRAAIIDFGGFFGVGSRKIAVDWRSLHFTADAKSDKVTVDLPKNQLKLAPLYKEGEPVVLLGPGTAAPAPASGEPTGPAPAAPAPVSPAAPATPPKP